MESNADFLMLKAVSALGKAKSMKRVSKPLAIVELIRGVSLMNKSIELEPQNIENRKFRLRHLLGVTMNSPKSYFKEIEDDILFFESQFDKLNMEDRSYYLSARGEYEIFKDNKLEGISILRDVINNYENTTMHNYAKVYLESIN